MKLKSLQDLSILLPDRRKTGTKPAARPDLRDRRTAGHDGRGREIRIRLDKKGRKGKTVTLVTGLGHNPATMKEIAHALKERCGTGGTVKEGNIELQGDQRERAGEELQKMNYVVK